MRFGNIENIRILQKLQRRKLSLHEKLAIMGIPLTRQARVINYFGLLGKQLQRNVVFNALTQFQELDEELVKRVPTACTLSVSLLFMNYVDGHKPRNEVEQAFSWAKLMHDPGILPVLLGFRRRAKPDEIRKLVCELEGERNE